ncbi:Peroxin-5 [Balamuthia mandrillaris]
MSMRDFVGSTECGEQNPVMRMVNQFTDDTTRRQQFEYAAAEEGLHEDVFGGGASSSASHEEVVRAHAHNQLGGFYDGLENLDNLDPSLDAFSELSLEDQERPGHFDALLQGPPRTMPPHARDQHLHHLFKSFIHSSRAQQGMMGGKLPDLNLSGIEKEKIRNRTGVLARQINPDKGMQGYVNAQLQNIGESLSLNQGPRGMHRAMERQGAASEGWAEEFMGKQRADEWADEFEGMHRHHGPREHEGGPWLDEFERFAAQERSWAEEFEGFNEAQYRDFSQVWNDVGAESWVNEFDQVKDSLSERVKYSHYLDSLTEEEAMQELRSLGQRMSNIQDPKLRSSKFVELMSQLGSGELTVEGNSLVKSEEGASSSTAGKDTLENWLSEYEEFKPPAQHSYDFSEFEGLEDMFPSYTGWGRLGEYEFQSNNPYSGQPAEEAFRKGIALFDRGELAESILAFEAVAQQEPTNTEAWRRLGEAHAENDRDDRAIMALTKAVQVDPANLSALLSLAVSCTNDSYRDQALNALKSWLQNNPRYKDLSAQWNGETSLETVTDMFIEAAQQSPTQPDENVHIALGLLFNLSQDYEKAIDCFRTALQQRQEDYQLWNKLGATLANSNHSKEALGPYYQALKIKPTYTRARANLGISYLNMEMYEEAARQFLACLAIQPSAKHIWMSLQTVFSRLERDDLLEKSLKYDVELFRGDFEF